jgi:hypothetical protein
MWYLMQHVSTIVGHSNAKKHDKTHKRSYTIAFPCILRSQITNFCFVNWDLNIHEKAIVCNLLCVLLCILARRWPTRVETCCIKYHIWSCFDGFLIPYITKINMVTLQQVQQTVINWEINIHGKATVCSLLCVLSFILAWKMTH